MIESLRIFEIDPELQIVRSESQVFSSFEKKVDNFFKEHIINSLSDKNCKVVRFRSENSNIFESCKKCFHVDDFEENSKKIADILTNNMHKSVTNNFNFIVLTYLFNDDEYLKPVRAQKDKKDRIKLIEKDSKILAIMKMETRSGVQIFEDGFKIQEDMLPDLGNRLQKCSFVHQSYIADFLENSKEDKFHSHILDKQDKSISNYFINLMDSVVVADDEEMSKLAQLVIKKEVKRYVITDADKIKVDNKMNSIMSRRSKTSIDSIVSELSNYMSEEMLEEDGYTLDGLSEDIFNLIRKKNPSAIREFNAIPINAEKFIIRNKDRSIWVSIEKGLIEDKVVTIDETIDSNGDEIHLIAIPVEEVD